MVLSIMAINDHLSSEASEKHITISETKTDSMYGCPPHKRTIEDYINMGVVNLDKPAGPTSHEVTAWVRDILGLAKAGHSGSLDPKVTGVQPIMLGKATKVVSVLRLSGKEYICLMRLHDEVPEPHVIRTCKEFTGPIYQLPPIKSAVKRALRVRTIYYLDVLEVDGRSVLMRVGCEAGTYIRKLCHDIGEVLGCGGHMQQLRRTGTGPFNEDTVVTLHDLKDAYLFWKEGGSETELRRVIRPMEEGLSHLPRIVIRDSAVDAMCHGASLAVPGIASLDIGIAKDDLVCLFSLKGEAVALCRATMNTDEIRKATCGIAAITERVIMDAGIYPRGWKAKPSHDG